MDLHLTPLDWTVTILSLVGSIALGTYLALRMRSGENSANFFLAGRKMTWPIIGASFFATNIGAEHLVGLSGDAYRYGLSGLSDWRLQLILLTILTVAIYAWLW